MDRTKIMSTSLGGSAFFLFAHFMETLHATEDMGEIAEFQ